MKKKSDTKKYWKESLAVVSLTYHPSVLRAKEVINSLTLKGRGCCSRKVFVFKV
jgi:hypothetical protein